MGNHGHPYSVKERLFILWQSFQVLQTSTKVRLYRRCRQTSGAESELRVVSVQSEMVSLLRLAYWDPFLSNGLSLDSSLTKITALDARDVQSASRINLLLFKEGVGDWGGGYIHSMIRLQTPDAQRIQLMVGLGVYH